MGNSSDICLGREKKGPQKFAELSTEEAYMIKKQQDLRLFIHSCFDLEQAFLSNLNFHSIKESEFLKIFTSLHLLRADNPEFTVSWQNFYTRLKVDQTEAGVLKPNYDIRSLMIALYFLTSSKASTKAQFITALFHEYGYYNDGQDKQVKDIKVQQNKSVKWEKVFQPGENVKEEIMKNCKLLKKNQEIKQIFTIFSALALNLLPYYASDYPESDKSLYYKLYCQWNAIREKLETMMINTFCKLDTELTPNDFIERAAQFPQFFDTFGIREEAKKEIERQQEFHQRNTASTDKDNENIPEVLKFDVPAKYAQAYLYKVVRKQHKSKKNMSVNFNKSQQIQNAKLEDSLDVKKEISNSLHKNIERSSQRIVQGLEVWDDYDKHREVKRRNRMNRTQTMKKQNPIESTF